MALSENRKLQLDNIVMQMETDGVDKSEIMEVVADFTEKYDETTSPQDQNVERAIALAIEEGAPPEEIRMLQSMHSSYTPEQRKAMVEDARKTAIENLPAGERYKVAGIDIGENAAKTFEMLFPYATSAMKKGVDDTQVGAGAYADVSSAMGRTLVGIGEQAARGAKGLVTGDYSGPTLKESIGDIERQNLITQTLAAPGTVESLAMGGILGKGVQALVPGVGTALKSLPVVSQILSKAPVAPIVQTAKQAVSKIPFMGPKGIELAAKTAPLAERVAPMAVRGGVTAIPGAATGQIRKYAETGEVDPIEAAIEVGASAVLDPTIETVGKMALKGGKGLVRGFLEKASGRSQELLDYIGLEEVKEGGSKFIKGSQKGYKSQKLDKIRNFGEQTEALAKDMTDKLDNFNELYMADPANKAYEAVKDLDLINVAPIRESLFEAKKKLAPAPFKYFIEMGKGEFKDGNIPIGYKFGTPTIDTQMAKIDELITLTGRPGQKMATLEVFESGRDLVDVSKVRKSIQEQKLVPTGWTGDIAPDEVPFGHKFGDSKIDGHNKKMDQLILQFGHPGGSPEQREARRVLKEALEGGKDIPPDLTNKVFAHVDNVDKKANYWTKDRINDLRKMNKELGDKSKNKALDNIFTKTQVYTEDADLWPAEQVMQLRNNLDHAISFESIQYGSDYASIMENLKKATRHTVKEELEAAAKRSGKQEYIDAMAEMHEKIDVRDQLKELMDSRNEWAGMERYQKFLLSLADDNKSFRKDFADKLSKLTGANITENSKLLKLGAEYKNRLPVFNDIRTGAGNFASSLFKETPLKWSAAVVGGPKGAAAMTGALEAATPAVKTGVEAARLGAIPVTSTLYERE